jgi:prepilin-type N-terminal cleavage/methylation domain-containing protein
MYFSFTTKSSCRQFGRYGTVFFRPCFTLIELLVALAIIGVLSGMVMVAMAGAQRDANVAKTRATIIKISNILLAKYRELSLAPAQVDVPHDLLRPRLLLSNQQPYYPVSGRELSRTKLIAIRHLLRWEMPDRPSDISVANSISLYLEAKLPDGTYVSPVVDLPVPFQNSTIHANIKPFKLDENGNPVLDSNGNPIRWDLYDEAALSFPDAKLLFQIVATATSEESSGLEDFQPSEIGDPDKDGNPEFIDAWGMPIRFIRWPAGAWKWSLTAKESRDSEVYSWVSTSANFPKGPDWIDQLVSGGDSLDPTRCDWRYMNDDRTLTNNGNSPEPFANDTKLDNPYDLIPLVVSAGSDRDFGLVFSGEDFGTTGPFYGSMTIPAGFTSNHGQGYRYPDPYYFFPSTSNSYAKSLLGYSVNLPFQVGDPRSDAHKDNVSNFDPKEY